MMRVTSSLVTKTDLADMIEAVLLVAERIPAREGGEEIYRAGFRSALSAIATAYDLNIPELRNVEADARRRNRLRTCYDMRL